MKHINTNKAPQAIGPYSQAVVCNATLYTSGQIAINPETGELVTDTLHQEAHQVMQNLEAVLEASNTNFSHVFKTTIFLKDMNDFDEVNEIYASYLDKDKLPARETVQVAKLPKNVRVEISMMAAVKEQ